MRSQTVLVTGGSSPLGDVMLPVLARIFTRVIATGRSDAAMSRVAAHGAQPLAFDLRDTTVPTVRADVLVHAAGIRLASGAVRLSRAAGARCTVAISSASATAGQHPDNAEIRAAEELLTRFGAVSILRPTMIYGSPRDRNVRRLNKALATLPAVPRFKGGGRLAPVFVDDVVAAIVETIESPRVEPIAVAGPNSVLFGELVDELCSLNKYPRLPTPVPVALLSFAGRVTKRRLGKVSHALEMLSVDRSAPSPTEVGFRYQPTDLSAGLRQALQRYE